MDTIGARFRRAPVFLKTTVREADYDELERPVFVHGYITYGTLYYLYTGENRQPDYGLCLDFNGGDGRYTELHPYDELQ